MVYICKNLKSWVKLDPQAMNEAYDECWRQKEILEEKLKKMEWLKVENKIMNNFIYDDDRLRCRREIVEECEKRGLK
jgi:hypothetical protein